jgi:DNA polymerase I
MASPSAPVQGVIDASLGGAGVRIARRISGKVVIENDESISPYFYLKAAKAPDAPGIVGSEQVELFLGGKREKLLKITVDRPARVPELRGLGKSFEADIPFLRRYLIDKGILPFIGVSPKTMVFDIETLSHDGVIPDSQKDEVIMISYAILEEGKITDKSVISSVGKRLPSFVEKVADEKALLSEFFARVRRLDPDIIAGYNSDNFDFPYLFARAKKRGVPIELGADGSELVFRRRGRMGGEVPEIFGRQVLDIYLFVRYIISHSLHTQTLDLDSVGFEVLGEKKVEIDFLELPGLIKRDELGKFCEYSLQDSVLTAKLADKFVPIILEISRFISLLPADVCRMTSGQIVEWFLIRESHLEGRVVPNRPGAELSGQRDERRFEGAFVREPEKGLHERLAVCDFRSLYPSIIIGHNIDPETIGKCSCCPDNTSPTGDHFCRNRFGIVPFSLNKIVKERAAMKKELRKLKEGTPERISIDAKQTAMKLISNSFYGYLGYQNSRWYSFEGARSTAGWGRKYIKETIDKAEKDGFRVVYGDTDSLFFSSPEKEGFSDKVGAFVKQVNSDLPEGMELELQDLYSRGVFLTKKRYAMITAEGKIVIKGLERVRRDWAGIARRTQEDVLMAILGEGSPEKAMEIISRAVADLRARKVSMDDVIIYTQLTKKPSQYKLTSPHVEAAKLGSAPAKAGTIVRFVIVKGSAKSTISSRARPADSVTLADYDPEYYIENQLLPAVMRIMEAVGYTESDAFKDQQKLEGFF